MPATVTLSTTTLAVSVGESDNLVKLASTSGVRPGTRLFTAEGGELMRVISLEVDPWVKVSRGVDGTLGTAHPSGTVVYIGSADQFYSRDPVGRPPEAIPVSPYINVLNGTIWFARGDALPVGMSNRWWQKQTTTYGTSSLGVASSTLDPTEST